MDITQVDPRCERRRALPWQRSLRSVVSRLQAATFSTNITLNGHDTAYRSKPAAVGAAGRWSGQ